MSRIADAAFGDEPVGYPRSPGFREPTTSREAAQAVTLSAPLLRERVYAVVRAAGAKGLTPDEAAAAIGETVLAVRPRMTELKLAGRIVETGERRANASGLKAKAWRAR